MYEKVDDMHVCYNRVERRCMCFLKSEKFSRSGVMKVGK